MGGIIMLLKRHVYGEAAKQPIQAQAFTPVNRHPDLLEIRGKTCVHTVMLELGQPRARKGKRKGTCLKKTVPKEMSLHIYMVRPRRQQVSR